MCISELESIPPMTHGLTLLRRFDGLDNRKTILDCFVRMGHNLPDNLAGARRAGFLQGVADIATGPFRKWIIEGSPSAGEAYRLFLQITAYMGVGIEQAVVMLERAVRILEKKSHGAPLEAGWHK